MSGARRRSPTHEGAIGVAGARAIALCAASCTALALMLAPASAIRAAEAPGAKAHAEHGRASAAAKPNGTIARPDAGVIADAYVYLLARVLVLRQERIDRGTPGFAWNAIRHRPPGPADVDDPGVGVATLDAWLAVDDRTLVLLDIPKIDSRYYTVQIADEWGEVIANVNERTFPSMPYGTFALVKPGSTVPVPAGAGRIELRSGKARMLARVELQDDAAGAIGLLRTFRLRASGTPAIKSPPPIPSFDDKKLIGVEIFDRVDATLASALDAAPNAAEMQQKARAVAAYAASGKAARADIDDELRTNIIPHFKDYASSKIAPERNGWMGGAATGNYGRDYWLRAAVNDASPWANSWDEVIEFVAARDTDGNALDGARSYVLEFPRDKLPQTAVNAFWSVALVGPEGDLAVGNALTRHGFDSSSKLALAPDGSLKIAIGPKPVPGVPEANWLSSPEGRPFSLAFRAYVPTNAVKRGEWAPPAVKVVRGE